MIKDLTPDGFSESMRFFACATQKPRMTASGATGGKYVIWLQVGRGPETMIGFGEPEEALREALAALDELKIQARTHLNDLMLAVRDERQLP